MEYVHVQFINFYATSITEWNGKNNDQFPEYYLPLVGQTDSPAHKLMPLVEPMCWADQDARPLSVDKQLRNVLFIAMFTCLKTTGALFWCTLSYHAELKHVYSIWGTVCLSTSVSYLCECETRAEVSATEVRQLSSIHAPQITC